MYNIPSRQRIQRIPLQGRFQLVPLEDFLLLFSTHNLYRLSLRSAQDQIDLLLDQPKPLFQQALQVARDHNLDQAFEKALHARYARALFAQGLFDDAMAQFLMAETPVEEVLTLFPELRFSSVTFVERSRREA